MFMVANLLIIFGSLIVIFICIALQYLLKSLYPSL
jgi:hypothetical protein